MNFKHTYVKGVKADIAKGELTLTFTVPMDKETMATAKDLSIYADAEAPSVEMVITPQQIAMFPPSGITSVTFETDNKKVEITND